MRVHTGETEFTEVIPHLAHLFDARWLEPLAFIVERVSCFQHLFAVCMRACGIWRTSGCTGINRCIFKRYVCVCVCVWTFMCLWVILFLCNYGCVLQKKSLHRAFFMPDLKNMRLSQTRNLNFSSILTPAATTDFFWHWACTSVVLPTPTSHPARQVGGAGRRRSKNGRSKENETKTEWYFSEHPSQDTTLRRLFMENVLPLYVLLWAPDSVIKEGRV